MNWVVCDGYMAQIFKMRRGSTCNSKKNRIKKLKTMLSSKIQNENPTKR